MPTPEHKSSEPWERSSDFIWTGKAYDLLEQDLLHAEISFAGGVLSSRVWGSCPRCAGPLDDRQVLTAISDFIASRGTAAEESSGGEPALVAVDVTCHCGVLHPNAPEGSLGCGVSFRVELEAESDPAAHQGQT
ncbi:hypothetical protein [Streptomyces lonegramiae]|uniref:Uncharacterized protein n=1 Tax=Streptomyces lonegramiae TaxID=3075524 RepID=A0ABU2XF12_9ACTN|nr:hypothetical protein [Streptomyces sp. DSM 41529]MDT0544507.1 hypothetical protein [Streptomyces sp. DSM 41529]